MRLRDQDADCLNSHAKTDNIYEWIKQNREHIDLSESVDDHMKDNMNEKVIGIFCVGTQFCTDS